MRARARLLPLALLAAAVGGSDETPLAALDKPRLLDRGLSYLTVAWSPPASSSLEATVYNLMLNGESVYTGAGLFYSITGLGADKCYLITVSAFVKDTAARGAASRWTPPSRRLRASTRAASTVSMKGLTVELAALREELERNSLSEPERGNCPVAGYASAVYIDGGPTFATYSGVSDEIATIGALASAYNCQRVACQKSSAATLPPGSPMVGKLQMAIGDARSHRFMERLARIHSVAAALQVTNPQVATQMITIPLRGCRTWQGERAPETRTDPAAKTAGHDLSSPCFRIECSASVSEFLFCTNSAELASTWVARLNEASHGIPRPQQWEVVLKASVATRIEPNRRRPREKGMWEQAGLRDAWVMSFLAALPRSGAAPHFPTLFGSFQCADLPKELINGAIEPRITMGLLPLRSSGMATMRDFTAAVDEGQDTDYAWIITAAEIFDSDLDAILADFRGPAIDERFARAVLFQILYAVGTARHAFGFHHNDLANLRNIKVRLVPDGAAARFEYSCYVTNGGAIAMLPLIFRDPAAAGVVSPVPGSRRKDRLFELIDGADACAREGPAKASLLQTHGTALSDEPALAQTAGDATASAQHADSSALNELGMEGPLRPDPEDADFLAPQDDQVEDLYEDAYVEDEDDASLDGPQFAEAGLEQSPAKPKSTSKSKPRSHTVVRGRVRTSWCVPMADSDGLQVVLSNFEVSSLTRTQLDWWKDGYAFPNTAWRDDVRDLANALCGRLLTALEGGSSQLEELCDRMRAGAFADRPLTALNHPFFTKAYPAVRGVHPSRRRTYVYTPLTIADTLPPSGSSSRRARSITRRVRRRRGEGGDGGDGDEGSGGDADERGMAAIAAARRAETYLRRTRGFMSGLLGLLTPPPPWVEMNDGSTLTLGWTAHKPPVRPLAPTMPSAPESFGLLMDRISVYSGPATTFALPAPPRGECHVFAVAAYYHALGWTPVSEPMTIGDCSITE